MNRGHFEFLFTSRSSSATRTLLAEPAVVALPPAQRVGSLCSTLSVSGGPLPPHVTPWLTATLHSSDWARTLMPVLALIPVLKRKPAADARKKQIVLDLKLYKLNFVLVVKT